MDNFGSSFGLFSDISSQICVDSLWNCSLQRSDVLPCSTTQLFPKRETAVISIACITSQKYLQQGDKFQRCYCSSVWFTATLYQVLSEHNQTYSRKWHAHYPDGATYWWRGPSRSEDVLPLWSAVMSIISVCVNIVILQLCTGLWRGEYNYSVSFNMCKTTLRRIFSLSLASCFMST